MLCPECQYPNPDDNKFCGNCGRKLPVTQYPREGYDEAEVPPVMPVAPDLVERTTPPSEARVRERVPAIEVPVIKEPVQDEPIPVSTESSSATKSANFFDLTPAEEPHTTSRSSLSGPSFLGLDETPYDYDEERPRSHALRNWLLFFFSLVAVLAFAEWRNIRDTGLRFAGTMQMKLPNKNGNPPAQTPTPPPQDTTASQPNPNGPDLLVAPTTNGSNSAQNAAPGSEGAQAGTTEKNSPPNAKADSNKAPDSAQPNPNPDKNQAAADKNNAAEATGESRDQKLAKANEEPPPAEKAAESTNSEASSDTPAPKPAKKAKVAAKPKVEPGEAELNQAYSTSNPEQKAKYLWDATSKGNTDASYLLADMYASGKGVRQNCEQARVLLDSAARRGNPRAQARLGMYYATGRCVKQDRAQAWQWLSRAHQSDPASDWVNQYRKQLLSEMTDQERARAGISTSAASE